MGVAVFPPEDFLSKHHHHHRQAVPAANKPRRNPSPTSNTNRSSRKRRPSPPGNQIRILKRGEEIPPVKKPEPAQKPDGFFAGSTVTSPPPSSVPLPAFFTGRRNCGVGNMEIESELKRVLKLV